VGTDPSAASFDVAELLLGMVACDPTLAACVARLDAALFEDDHHARVHQGIIELLDQAREPTYSAISGWLLRRGNWHALAGLDLAHIVVLECYLNAGSPEGRPRNINCPSLIDWLKDGVFERTIERLECFEGAIWF